MAKGTVRLFHSSRHYGFIRQDSGGEDVFVHLSAVRLAGLKSLRKGQKVSFDVFDNQGKLAAKNLRVEKSHGDTLLADAVVRSTVKKLEDESPGEIFEDQRILVGAATGTRFEMIRKNVNQPQENRQSINRVELERILADAVKISHSECEAFVGVIVERITPASPGGSNWTVKGVKFGRADRELCRAALEDRVNRGYLEFQVSD
jgi:cold shock CspA family protein